MGIRRLFGSITLLTTICMLAACGGSSQISETDLRATVEAEVRATVAAEPQATTPPASEPSVATSAPAAAPTQAPFAPPTAAATARVAQATAAPQAGATAAPAADTPLVFEPPDGQAGPVAINLELVFDASGSMAQDIGGETKIEAARRAMERVIAALPDNNPNLKVGFRVYGHKGDNSEARKAESCQSTELLVPMQAVDKNLLRQQANAWEPTGWTPISLALQKAGEDLQPGEQTHNVIIMVTDGEETCAGDPCAVAQALNQAGAEVRIDVVGFGLEPGVARNLQCIADNSGGIYTDAQDGDALAQTLEDLISATFKRSYLRIVAVGADGQPSTGLSFVGMVDAQGKDVAQYLADATGQGQNTVNEALGRLALNDGQTRVELPPGTYQFTIESLLPGSLGGSGQTQLTYTAIVAEGQETIATIGFGSIVFTSEGAAKSDLCAVSLQAPVSGAWQEAAGLASGGPVCPGHFEFDRAYDLMPGRYRLYNIVRNAVVSDNIVIEPGKKVTVRIAAGQGG